MKPEHVVRFGYLSASIFANEIQTESGKKLVRNVRFEKRYKDQEGKWQTTSSLSLTDLPVAIAVLKRAQEHVAGKEADHES